MLYGQPAEACPNLMRSVESLNLRDTVQVLYFMLMISV